VPTGKRREREREERREAILDAAERVFAEKGFLTATMDEIAAQAELSKGALYLYFKNKDELFLGHSTRALEALIETITAELDAGRPGLPTLRALLLAYGRFVEEHPRDFSNAMQWILAGSDVDPETRSFQEHRSCIGRLLGAFAAAADRGRRDGTVRGDLEPAQTGARLWCALIGGLIVRINTTRMIRCLPPDMPLQNTDHLLVGLVDMLCRGIAADPGAPATAGAPSTSKT